MRKTLSGLLTGFAMMASLCVQASPAETSVPTEWQVFAQEVAAKTHWTADEVIAGLRAAQKRQDILDAIARPAEGKPWFEYRPIFLTEKRIREGLAFWKKHKEALDRAEQEFKVPAEMIVAIIGVETFYGRIKGHHRVLDALYTLGFHYPPRQTFFRKELARYFELAEQEQWPLTGPVGSYAGAMGLGQFMPSSYLMYAVDFDGDGHRDLMDNPTDAIGSVANYFRRHGWQWQEPVVRPIRIRSWKAAMLAGRDSRLRYGLHDLKRLHIELPGAENLPPATRVSLIRLRDEGRNRYYAGFQNFYVITRYNRSPLYAMAAWQLAETLRERMSP
jgi:membrane-bound lytic murein transglycosylase B